MDEKNHSSDISIELHIDNKIYSIYEFFGKESISIPFCFVVSYFDNSSLAQNSYLLGKSAKIILKSIDNYRQIIGVIDKITLTFCHYKNLYRWQLAIVPKISLLKNSFGPRVFIGKTPKEIIDCLLKSCGYEIKNIKWHFLAKNKTLPHVLQLLHETDFDFLQRFFSVEGIFFWFEADNNHETIHLGQDNISLSQHPGALKYYANLKLVFDNHDNNIITDLCICSHVLTKNICVYDYQTHNYHQTFASPDRQPFQKKYFGVNVLSNDEAQELTSLFLHAENANNIKITAKSQDITLTLAHLYELNLDNFDEQYSGTYILTSIKHHFQKDIDINIDVMNTPYQQSISFIPHHLSLLAVPNIFPEQLPEFSAMIKTTNISNSSTINSHGAYSLQYHFDRENNDFLLNNIPKVSHFNAGLSQDNFASGLHYPLTKNAEVIIAYIDNNSYKPVIIATIANNITKNIVNFANDSQHYFKTPSQQSLLFNDDEHKSIELSNPNNLNYLKLSSQYNAEKIAVVTQQNDIMIKANQELISSCQENMHETCLKDKKIFSENTLIQKSLANTFLETALNQQWSAKNAMTVNSDNLQIKQGAMMETSVLQNSFTNLYGSSYYLTSFNGKISHQSSGNITIQALGKDMITLGGDNNLINMQMDGSIIIENNTIHIQTNGTLKFKGKIKHFR